MWCFRIFRTFLRCCYRPNNVVLKRPWSPLCVWSVLQVLKCAECFIWSCNLYPGVATGPHQPTIQPQPTQLIWHWGQNRNCNGSSSNDNVVFFLYSIFFVSPSVNDDDEDGSMQGNPHAAHIHIMSMSMTAPGLACVWWVCLSYLRDTNDCADQVSAIITDVTLATVYCPPPALRSDTQHSGDTGTNLKRNQETFDKQENAARATVNKTTKSLS